jgi:hypothetical protein
LKPAYWYYGLVITSLALLIISISHKKDFKLLVLSLVISDLLQAFEVIVLIILPGYRYLPQILPDPSFDNIGGAYVSDFFIVPAFAVAINAFSLSWVSIAGIAAIFTVIDWFFNNLGIYEHYWWNSMYTGIGLIILYTISKWIWQRLTQDSPSLLFRLAVVYLGFASIYSSIHFIFVGILQLYRFHIGWLQNPIQEHFLIASAYMHIVAAIVALSLGLKLGYRANILIVALLAVINWLLGYYNILVPLSGFAPVFYTLILVIATAFLICVFRLAKLDHWIT